MSDENTGFGFNASTFGNALEAEEGEVRVVVDMDKLDEEVSVPAEGMTVRDILNSVGFSDILAEVNDEMAAKSKEVKEIALYQKRNGYDAEKINDDIEQAMGTVLKGGTVLEVRFKVGANSQ